MNLLAGAGDRAGAIQQYQTCERLLLNELGVGPSSETLDLLDWIKTGPVTPAPRRTPNELHNSGDPGQQREQLNKQFHSSSEKTGKVRRAIDADRPSIAVLPFANLSPDPDQEFFADGLADDIINTLSKISRMRVIARHSTFAYKGRQLDVRAIAEELGVRYVLEGSVRRAGDRLRVTAQLVDTKDGSPLWAERFDRQVEDLFDIQDEITKEVVTALQVELTVGEEARVWSRGTNSIEAWQHCVQAIECQYRLTATHHLQARKLAERALELDPNYAYAWGVLGFSYYREARLDASGDRLARLERAAEIAEKATCLDSSASWVVGLRAATTAALGDHEKAIEIATQAIEMQPGNADVRAYLGLVLAFDGRFGEAIDQVEIASSLNPHSPIWYQTSLVRSLSLSGAYDEAVRVAREMLQFEPDHFPARFFLTYALQQLGLEMQARESIAALRQSVPHFRTSHIDGFLTMRDRQLVDRVIETFRQAGLPDADPPAHAIRPSIAVLPFENLTSDPDQEFLADGMAEDLIAGLSKFGWLFVIARRSTFTYKGQAKDIREIAEELGVRYLVEGSIRRAANRIRVTVQLVDAETGNQIWSDRYDRDLEDIFAVQDEVAVAILQEIAPEIGHAEIVRARRTPPENLDAWGYYQHGLALEPSGEIADFEASIAQFDRAIAADPTFVEALAMAALQRSRYVFFFQPANTSTLLSEAEHLLQSAFRTDPRSACAHFARGRFHKVSGDLAAAIRDCEEAVNLDPNSALAHLQLAAVLGEIEGRAQESLDAYEQVLRLSPKDPHRAAVFTGRAYNLFHLGRYEDCIESAKTALKSENPRYWAIVSLVAGLSEMGRTEELTRARSDLLVRKPDVSISSLSRSLAFSFPKFAEALRRAGIPE